MKTKNLLLLMLVGLALACRKESREVTPAAVASHDSLSLAEVRRGYSGPPGLDWSKAQSFNSSRSNYWLLPLPGRLKQGYRKLAFLRDSTGRLQVRILEIVPDVLYWQRKGRVSTADFTGRVYIYDQAHHFLGGKIYASGKQIGESRPGPAGAVNTTRLKTNMVYVSENCDWYDHNYVDGDGNAVICSERICTYSVYDDGFYPATQNEAVAVATDGDPLGGGGGGGEPPPPPDVSNLPGEDHSKINPQDYVRCFSSLSNTGATMSVTLYVQEPFPGTVFNLGPNSVGHTAIGLSKTNGGMTITQTVGYYPDATGKSKMHAPSKVVDNGGTLDYDVSITYNVSAAQFQAILDYINTPPPTYDLISNNCTTFAVQALANSGIMPPPAYASVGLSGPGGATVAMTPAGLGSGITAMKGQPGVNTSGGHVGPSHGPCN